jgi:hypothetical protein
MISVRPVSASSIPSVVMNELMRRNVVSNPFARPTSRHIAIASVSATSSGSPATWNSWNMNGANR